MNRKGVLFHYDNAKSYNALATKQKLQGFAWEVVAPTILTQSFYKYAFQKKLFKNAWSTSV